MSGEIKKMDSLDESNKHKVKFLPSVRFGLVVMWFYGCVSFYMIRSNFGVSIVCMTIDPIENDTSTNNTYDEACDEATLDVKETGVFEWDRTMRGLVNSAFYVGYLPSNLLGGILAHNFGPKWVHFGGLTCATVASLLCPVSSEGSPWGLFAVRIMLGLGCGVFVPCLREMVSNWSPIYEKSMMYTMATSGFSIGNVLAFSLTGILCENLGWESTFYIPSLFPIVYLALFAFLGSNDPDKYRCVGEKERKYIMMERTQKPVDDLPIPWRGIFTSGPCWSMFICYFCTSWGGYTVLTSGAQYMSDVLKFDIQTNGLLNALPQLVKFVVLIVAGISIDYIRRQEILSTTNARKLAQTISMLGPAGISLGIGFMDCNSRGAVVAMLCLGEAFGSLTGVGISINIMEVAPRFVPVLGGIFNAFSTLAGVICPIVAGVLTPNGTREEWQKVFFISGGFFVAGWLQYMILGDTTEQPWARAPGTMDTETKITKKGQYVWSNDKQIVGTSYTVNGIHNGGFVGDASCTESDTKIVK